MNINQLRVRFEIIYLICTIKGQNFALYFRFGSFDFFNYFIKNLVFKFTKYFEDKFSYLKDQLDYLLIKLMTPALKIIVQLYNQINQFCNCLSENFFYSLKFHKYYCLDLIHRLFE